MNLETTRLRGRPRNRWQDDGWRMEYYLVEKGRRKEYITERNGRSSWERRGIFEFCTCQWNYWILHTMTGIGCNQKANKTCIFQKGTELTSETYLTWPIHQWDQKNRINEDEIRCTFPGKLFSQIMSTNITHKCNVYLCLFFPRVWKISLWLEMSNKMENFLAFKNILLYKLWHKQLDVFMMGYVRCNMEQRDWEEIGTGIESVFRIYVEATEASKSVAFSRLRSQIAFDRQTVCK